MGCGESKHAVATADTISQSKSRSNSMKIKGGETSIEKATDDVKTATNTDGVGNGKEKEDENIDEKYSAEANGKAGDQNVGKHSEVGNGKEGENLKADNVKESDQPNGESAVENVKEREKKEVVEAAVVVDDMKDASKKKELKEETGHQSKKNDGGAKEQEEGKLPGPDPPNHFFSPKRNEETIASIISDGIKRDAAEQKTDLNGIAEEKGSTSEMKTPAKNDEALNKNGVDQIGEGEAVASSETKDSANTDEDRISSAKKENAEASSAKDQKIN